MDTMGGMLSLFWEDVALIRDEPRACRQGLTLLNISFSPDEIPVVTVMVVLRGRIFSLEPLSQLSG